jgi:hypothetical protein
VNVVNFLDTFDSEDGASDFLDPQIVWTAFEEQVRGFAKDADAGPEHENANGQAEKRIDPRRAGHANENGAHDDGDIGNGVAEIVNEDGAKVQVTAPADESQSDAAIHRQSGGGGPDHPFFDDLDGRAESLYGFITQPECKQYKHKRIGEGC